MSATPRRRRLTLEALESRSLMTAGITATLLEHSHTLLILGTSGDDRIVLRTTANGGISIDGVKISWRTSAARSTRSAAPS